MAPSLDNTVVCSLLHDLDPNQFQIMEALPIFEASGAVAPFNTPTHFGITSPTLICWLMYSARRPFMDNYSEEFWFPYFYYRDVNYARGSSDHTISVSGAVSQSHPSAKGMWSLNYAIIVTMEILRNSLRILPVKIVFSKRIQTKFVHIALFRLQGSWLILLRQHKRNKSQDSYSH